MSHERQNCVDLIYESDKEQLFELRASSYKRQYGQNVDVTALRWNSWDERFINLGVFEGPQLVSTLRIARVNSLEEYKKIMLCEFDPAHLEMPLVILSRAATQENRQSEGLHSLLRYYALSLTSMAGIHWVIGTFKKNSQRVSQLTEMGYELSTNPIPWQSFLKSNEPTYVASLNLQKYYPQAQTRLLTSAKDLIKKYPVQFDTEDLIERMHRA